MPLWDFVGYVVVDLTFIDFFEYFCIYIMYIYSVCKILCMVEFVPQILLYATGKRELVHPHFVMYSFM